KNILGNIQRVHILLNILKKTHPTKPYDLLIDFSQSIATLLDEVILSGIAPNEILSYFYTLGDIKPHQQILHSTLVTYYDYLHKNHLIERTQQNFNDIIDTAHLLEETYYNNKKLPHPIILAGTTGTIPAVQVLAKTLLSLENGYVVLPGLQKSSQDYPITHPLYTQAAFVKAIGKEDTAYQHWYRVGADNSELMSFFDNHIQDLPAQNNFLFLKAKTLLHEAQLVTAVIRHHLEESPDDDIAIVCADPKLSLYIQNSLQKYNFQANSSLSLSIKQSVAFKFLLLYLNFLQVQDLKSLLALVKHPFFQVTGRINVLNNIDAFEAKIKIDDVETYAKCLKLFPDLEIKTQGHLSIIKWFNYIRKNLDYMSAEAYGIKHDGEAVFQFFDELSLLEKKNLSPVPLQVFIDYVKSSFKLAPPLNNQDNLHQRVTMVGSLEARHITASIVILTALNEGQWPPTIKNDIWLSKLDREKLGMPALDRRLGLSAHDFASTLSAKKVYFTRSLKIDGTPTQESRWLRRLFVFCIESEEQKKAAEWFYDIAKQLQLSETADYQHKAPSYPLCNTKINKLSVSALELLNKNPYTFYTRYILKLRPRNPWFLGLSPADIGNIIHKILEHISFDTDQQDSFLNIIKKAIDPLNIAPPQKIFLQNQISTVVNFVVNATQVALPQKILREEKLQAVLNNFMVYGIADRIDFVHNQNEIHLIDYKTGVEPSKAMIEKGESFQLPLLTYMLSCMFKKDYANIISAYWVLKGYAKDDTGNGCKISARPQTPESIEFTIDIVKKLLKHFLENHNPFLPTDEVYKNQGVHPLERY
ncbi:MAG TPA: hypothetical protein DIC42_05770, partial [Holosporales bacterium]|nr:hypothetical protein [Holosporales bacterium]